MTKMANLTEESNSASQLMHEIQQLIEQSRSSVAVTVNAGLTMLYWQIGRRINQELLQDQRADYGQRVLHTLSAKLTVDYGQGFSEKNLRRMIQFSQVFIDEKIVVSAIRQLSWTHFIALIPLKNTVQREFYTEMCRIEKWSVRTLRQKINSMLYERTAISRKPESVVKAELEKLRDKDRISPDLVFRDPYILDFLGLNDRYLERDIEDAILRELERFLLELGTDFTFIARQKRIQIDSDDFYIDLLFYHRNLRRLVCIELKLGDFKPEHKGQMELYLRWLDKYERRPEEDAPLGIILCAGKKQEQIELLELDKSGLHVAEYLTELPHKDILQRKLHKAIKQSRLLAENRTGNPYEETAKLKKR